MNLSEILYHGNRDGRAVVDVEPVPTIARPKGIRVRNRIPASKQRSRTIERESTTCRPAQVPFPKPAVIF